MNGVLVVDKPAGPTSHDVVARLRRALRLRRIGHTGTLDPIATGVLPLVVGRATRLARFFSAMPKQYLATVLLGHVTDTYDIAGAPEPPASMALPARSDVEVALAAFRGAYAQAAPPFSARKVAGTRAYVLARQKRPVRPGSRQVTVESLNVVDVQDDRLILRLRCSTGFYVRVLAHELGQRLGCGACLEALRREESGGYRIENATPLETVEQEGPQGIVHIVSLDRLLTTLPGLILNERGSRRAAHGNVLSPGDLDTPSAALESAAVDVASGLVRLLDRDGGLLGLGEVGPAGILRPRVVLV